MEHNQRAAASCDSELEINLIAHNVSTRMRPRYSKDVMLKMKWLGRVIRKYSLNTKAVNVTNFQSVLVFKMGHTPTTLHQFLTTSLRFLCRQTAPKIPARSIAGAQLTIKPNHTSYLSQEFSYRIWDIKWRSSPFYILQFSSVTLLRNILKPRPTTKST